VNKNATIWWYHLEKFVLNEYGLFSKDALKRYYRLSKQLLESGKQVRTEIVKITNKNYLYEENDTLTIDLTDLISLNNNPLCTISVHTYNHYSLRYLDNFELIEEIEMALEDFRKKNINVSDHFAYPYGSAYSVGRREVSLARKYFKTSVSTYDGFIYYLGTNLHLLPRINVVENVLFLRKIKKFTS
jgi:peptidoglycan/xylan/chitin deacetylase (PgdA/CDA1 family)